MSDDGEDDDPENDWLGDQPTNRDRTVALEAEDLAEIMREEKTPTRPAPTLPGYELGVTAAIAAMDEILVVGQTRRVVIDRLADLIREKLRISR